MNDIVTQDYNKCGFIVINLIYDNSLDQDKSSIALIPQMVVF